MSTLTSWVVPYEDLPRGYLRISRVEFRWVMAILLVLLSVVLFEIVRVWLGPGVSPGVSEAGEAPQVPQVPMMCLLPAPAFWPVWPIGGRGWVTSEFGYRRSPFRRVIRFHEGIDVASPRGTPVVSAAKGVVVYAGPHGGLGRTVIIAHEAGVSSVYGHASKLLVRKGQWIERGTLIARVGSTGRSTGPHLHYEIHVDGVPVNPLNYYTP